MTEFFETVRDVPVIRYALLAGLVSSLTFGVVGTFVVTRRIGYIAAAIAHSILGGIGASIYFSRTFDLPWLTPMMGAIVAAVLSALVIGWISLRFHEREDTIISAIWAGGMATGLLFLHHSPGQGVNLESYIFGNILLTSQGDVIATCILGAVVILLVALFYHKLVAVCFDEEFVRLRDVSSRFYFLLLLVITGICMVLLVRVAGIVLSLALIILPAATASRLAGRMWTIMVVAVLLSVFYNAGGLIASFELDQPTGPFVVVSACVIYGLSFLVKRGRKH
ncbi:MAG: metal ABC transporter permease [Verrucomicrobiota bacterium]